MAAASHRGRVSARGCRQQDRTPAAWDRQHPVRRENQAKDAGRHNDALESEMRGPGRSSSKLHGQRLRLVKRWGGWGGEEVPYFDCAGDLTYRTAHTKNTVLKSEKMG